jgi:hypothetical protein
MLSEIPVRSSSSRNLICTPGDDQLRNQ